MREADSKGFLRVENEGGVGLVQTCRSQPLSSTFTRQRQPVPAYESAILSENVIGGKKDIESPDGRDRVWDRP